MVSQQAVLNVNNLHSITPTKSKISFLGLGKQSQMVYLCRKPSSKKHLWLGSMSLMYPSYMPVNNLVMLTYMNLLNLLHIRKYNQIAVTVQEKIYYVIEYEVILSRHYLDKIRQIEFTCLIGRKQNGLLKRPS